MTKLRITTVFAALMFLPISVEVAQAHVLTNSPGDGTLSVGVDGFGSFGSSVGGTGTQNLRYDPVGALGPAGTTYESGVAIGFGGGRSFLTSGFIRSSGGLTDPGFSATSNTSASSSFSFQGLDFALTQSIAELTGNNGNRVGTKLTQSYSITNSSSAPISFDLVRYLDGDLSFDGSISDGGGVLAGTGGSIYFETDAGGTGGSDSTFIGVNVEGGDVPATGAFEIDSFPGLGNGVVNGSQLTDSIAGDNDGDGFIDPGQEYDVTLAARRTFDLSPGQTADFTTVTFAGSGPPTGIITNPEPSSIAVWGLVGLISAASVSRLRRHQQAT